jgi:hypothetical protein
VRNRIATPRSIFHALSQQFSVATLGKKLPRWKNPQTSGKEEILPQMQFQVDGHLYVADVRDLVIAGWTGRDTTLVERHIAELEAIDIPRPRTTPMFYRVGANLLTTATNLDVAGSDASGEVEFVLLLTPDGLFVGVGSDHTDRKVEAYDVTVSKQVCPKPVGKELWSLNDIREHWDSLILRSWITCDGGRRLYQEGPVTKIFSPEELISRYSVHNGSFPVGTLMYGGTLPVLDGMSCGEKFEMELEDPVRRRSLRHAYHVRNLAYAD